MRILSLDVGDRRIGVAASDPSGTLASTVMVLERRNIKTDVARIAELVREYDVSQVVVGLPMRLDGSLGEQAAKVQAFARRLAEGIDKPIVFWDERYSTAGAQKLMIEAGIRRAKRKQRIDSAAAALILQEYLEYLSTSHSHGGGSQ